MSFYEDYVAEGSHCASCCQLIGDDVGYTRLCPSCKALEPKAPPPAKTSKLTRTQKRNAQKRRERERAKQEAQP